MSNDGRQIDPGPKPRGGGADVHRVLDVLRRRAAVPEEKPVADRSPLRWPEEYRETWEERAATREYEGGFEGSNAEKLAAEDVRRQQERSCGHHFDQAVSPVVGDGHSGVEEVCHE